MYRYTHMRAKAYQHTLHPAGTEVSISREAIQLILWITEPLADRVSSFRLSGICSPVVFLGIFLSERGTWADAANQSDDTRGT